ncbi:LysR family transcriptional regulator [Aeromicrobium phragmitis]|uniref:LysR family transcriptional regulator n=1 Tax=Aeromicrobium phragmitis TaxID=2478914 RepID=A0A3L8PQT6_9ACTN|nr:LysR family transcriptional regulator [Aeromicrobium phragmitis]RLV57564.1 LysR family transcriptional regulator [Aeromicrobium phragmitis]
MVKTVSTLSQVHVQQIECLLTLAEELHFGRTAERLGYSQSRASQLISSLEQRIGARLVQRTSRRVSLTRLGEQFVREVRPAYQHLASTFVHARERAMWGALEELRIGFTGMVYEEITRTFRVLDERHGVTVHTRDLPLGSPFDALFAGDVDAAIIELPVHEPGLTVGFRFPPQDQFLAIAQGHPLTEHPMLDIESLAAVDLLHREGGAPHYWMSARTPPTTPSGMPIVSTTGITTVQQGLALAATGRHGMLVCKPVADHSGRADLAFLPVQGLEGTSQLALVWPAENATPSLTALARLLEEAHLMD